MRKNISALSTFIFLLVVIISCRQNNSAVGGNLPVTMDDSSRVIIDRAIAYAGGYDAWLQKKTISFDKKTISYDSTSHVAREMDMHLDYMMNPKFRANLTYKLHDTTITIIHNGEKARKLYNGKVSDEQKDIDAAWNSSYGSQYVMCIPFKLKDPGIIAKYVGQLTLAEGTDAQVVKATYKQGAGSNNDHIWYYYFEPGTGKLLANSFNGKDNYWDFTRYTDFEKVNGLMLPSVRKTYSADTLNNQGKLLTENRHTNIVFDKNLPENHFQIP